MEKMAMLRRHPIPTIVSLGVCLVFLVALGLYLLRSSPGHSPSTSQILGALPYLTWSKPSEADRTKRGVTLHREGACEGLNLLLYQSYPGVYLTDMKGRLIHSWGQGKVSWHHAELLPGGELLLIDEEKGNLVKMDWHGRVLWSREIYGHHSVTAGPSGEIYLLTQQIKPLPQLKTPRAKEACDNGLAILSRDGLLRKEILLSKLLFQTDIPRDQITSLVLKNHVEGGPALDVFHANHIEVIRRDVIHGARKVLKKGDLLLCIRNLNLVVALDLQQERIIWRWGMTELDRPHHPTMLENGNILIFDNGSFRKYSRIVELDPRTKKIVWQYSATSKESFFSMASGSSQRLPNGNTLITDSLIGRVFEVTSSGEVVWEFHSEVFNKEGERKAIWRVTRLTSPSQLIPLASFWKDRSPCQR